jgi:hypothetical protein
MRMQFLAELRLPHLITHGHHQGDAEQTWLIPASLEASGALLRLPVPILFAGAVFLAVAAAGHRHHRANP